jgi:hypothetical protein
MNLLVRHNPLVIGILRRLRIVQTSLVQCNVRPEAIQYQAASFVVAKIQRNSFNLLALALLQLHVYK